MALRIVITGEVGGLGDRVSGEIAATVVSDAISGGPFDKGHGAPGVKIVDEIDIFDDSEKNAIESIIMEQNRVHPSEGVIIGRWGRKIQWRLTGEELEFVKSLRRAWKEMDAERGH